MQTVKLDGAYEDRLKFEKEELAIVRRAIKTKLFNSGGTIEQRVPKFQTMLRELADKFGIPSLRIQLHPLMQMKNATGFLYRHDTVIVGRLSLTSILSAFATHLHHHTENGVGKNEEFVKAFGLSMFKQAAPRLFNSAKDSGRLFFTDTPYTDGGRRSVEEARPPESSEEDGGNLDNPGGED